MRLLFAAVSSVVQWTMRRMSRKRQTLMRTLSTTRWEWLYKHHKCWVCGAMASDVHEIVGGVHRHRTVQDPRYWFSTCRICHTKLHDVSQIPRHRQWLLKRANDPDHYDPAVAESSPWLSTYRTDSTA